MKNIFYFLFLFFVLASCTNQMSLSSVNFESCFMSYKEPSEIEEVLKKLNYTFNVQPEKSTEKEITFLKPVMGCLTYQLGRYAEAEQWLLQSLLTEKQKQDKDQEDLDQEGSDQKNLDQEDQKVTIQKDTKDIQDTQENIIANNKEAKRYKEIRSMAASALGLIYLKEFEKDKIEPFIDIAKTHYLGRWMLILYHIEFYRETNERDYLKLAINQLEEKNEIEGETTATKRLLNHMKIIYSMEEACIDKQSELCSFDNLMEEKRYLLSTAFGFLSMLLKKPPLNNQ